MTQNAFNLLGIAINQCVKWVDMLFSRLDASMYVVAAAIVVFSVGLFLRPLRGGNIGFVGYSVNKIHDSNKAKAARAKYTKTKSRKSS